MTATLGPTSACFDELCIAAVPWPAARVAGHSVTAVAFSSQLGILATGCLSGWVYLWNVSLEADTEPFGVPYVACVAEWSNAAAVLFCYFAEWSATYLVGTSSPVVLITHHADGMLRWWCVEDGRCFATCATAAFLGSPACFSAILLDSRYLAIASSLSIAVVDVWLRVPCLFLAFSAVNTPLSSAYSGGIRTVSLQSVLRMVAPIHIHHFSDTRDVECAGAKEVQPENLSRGLTRPTTGFSKRSRYVAEAAIVSFSSNTSTVNARAVNTRRNRTVTLTARVANSTVFAWDLTLHLARWRQITRLSDDVPKRDKGAGGRAGSLGAVFPQDGTAAGHLLVVEPMSCISTTEAYCSNEQNGVWVPRYKDTEACGDDFVALLSEDATKLVVYYQPSMSGLHDVVSRPAHVARRDIAKPSSKSTNDLTRETHFAQESPLAGTKTEVGCVSHPFLHREVVDVPTLETSLNGSTVALEPPVIPSVLDAAAPGSRWLGISVARHVDTLLWMSLVKSGLQRKGCWNHTMHRTFVEQGFAPSCSLIVAFADDGRIFLYNPSIWSRGRKPAQQNVLDSRSMADLRQLWSCVYLMRLPMDLIPFDCVKHPFPLMCFANVTTGGAQLSCCNVFAVSKSAPDQLQCIRLVRNEDWTCTRWDRAPAFSDMWAGPATSVSPLAWTSTDIAKKYFLIRSRADGRLTSHCLNSRRRPWKSTAQGYSGLESFSDGGSAASNAEPFEVSQDVISAHGTFDRAAHASSCADDAKNNSDSLPKEYSCLRKRGQSRVVTNLPAIGTAAARSGRPVSDAVVNKASSYGNTTGQSKRSRHIITSLTVICRTIVVGGSSDGDFFWWSLPRLQLEGMIPALHIASIQVLLRLGILESTRRYVVEDEAYVCSVDASHQLVIVDLTGPGLRNAATRRLPAERRHQRHAFSPSRPLASHSAERGHTETATKGLAFLFPTSQQQNECRTARPGVDVSTGMGVPAADEQCDCPSVNVHDYWTVHWKEKSGVRRVNALKDSRLYTGRLDALAVGAPQVIRLPRHPDLEYTSVQKIVWDIASAVLVVHTGQDELFLFCSTSQSFVTRINLSLLASHIVYAATVCGSSREGMTLAATATPYDLVPPHGGVSRDVGEIAEQQRNLWWEWLQGYSQTFGRSSLFQSLDLAGLAPKETTEVAAPVCLGRPYLYHPGLWGAPPSTTSRSEAVWFTSLTLGQQRLIAQNVPDHRVRLSGLAPVAVPVLLISLTRLLHGLPSVCHQQIQIREPDPGTTYRDDAPSKGSVQAPPPETQNVVTADDLSAMLRTSTRNTPERREVGEPDRPSLTSGLEHVGADEHCDTVTPREEPANPISECRGQQWPRTMVSCLGAQFLATLVPEAMMVEAVARLAPRQAAALFTMAKSTLGVPWMTAIVGTSMALSILLPPSLVQVMSGQYDPPHHFLSLALPKATPPCAPGANVPLGRNRGRATQRRRVLDLTLVAKLRLQYPCSWAETQRFRDSFGDHSEVSSPVVSSNSKARAKAVGTQIDVSPFSRHLFRHSRVCSLRLNCVDTRPVQPSHRALRRLSTSTCLPSQSSFDDNQLFSVSRAHRSRSASVTKPDNLLGHDVISVSGSRTVWALYLSWYAQKVWRKSSAREHRKESVTVDSPWIWDLFSGSELATATSSYLLVLYLLSLQYLIVFAGSEASENGPTSTVTEALESTYNAIGLGLSRGIAVGPTVGLWGALMLHPSCTRLRRIAQTWCELFVRYATVNDVLGIAYTFSFLLSTAEKEQGRRINDKTDLGLLRAVIRETHVPVSDLFYAPSTSRRQSDANPHCPEPVPVEFDSHQWSLLVLCILTSKRPEALKGLLALRSGEPLPLLIARRLLTTVGTPELWSSELTSTLLDLFREGYPFVYRWALLGCPQSATMFSWQLWSTECAELSYAADMAAEQRAAETVKRASPNSMLGQTAALRGERGVRVSSENSTIAAGTPASRWCWLIHQLMLRIFKLTQYPPVASGGALVLLEMGRHDPLRFIRAMGFCARRLDQGATFSNSALLLLVEFYLRHPMLALRYLSQIVDAVVKCLDPAHPSLRRNALGSATAALFQLVRLFPMITFHQTLQRFAVGNYDGFIVIYDLRTATKWRVLDAHTGPISVIAFTSDGGQLASYSAADQTFCLWQCSASGFFGGILGGSGKCQKLLRLPRPSGSRTLTAHEQLRVMRLEARGQNDWLLKREDGRAYAIRV